MVGVPKAVGTVVDIVGVVFIDVFRSGFEPFDFGRTGSAERELTGLRTGFRVCSGLFSGDFVIFDVEDSSFSDLESISFLEIFDSGGLLTPSLVLAWGW